MASSQPECVIALAYGYRRVRGQIVPGPPNEELAAVVHSQYSHLPKILQFEVADAFATLDSEPVLRIERHRSNSYLDTREVLVQASALCRKSGWNTVALVAHPLHVPRIQKCAERLGLKTDPIQLALIQNTNISFDKSSEQSWTRSEPAMRFHEALAGVLYRVLKY